MNFVEAFAYGMGVKKAAPRAVKEWRRSMQAGNDAGADQIARGYGQANLPPRYLKDVSGGGMEAAVDLQMGRAGQITQQTAPSFQDRLKQFKNSGSATSTAVAPTAAPNESGYIARKLYKPDSPVSTGIGTSALLGQKQQYTDAARAVSPEAKAMVPAMYGHQTRGAGDLMRHTSQHEYVPGAAPLHRSDVSTPQHLQAVQKQVTTPMASKNMPLGDVGFVENGVVKGNASNVALDRAGKPKVLDFIPQGAGRAVIMDPKGEQVFSSNGRIDTKYDGKNVAELRKEVFRPKTNFETAPAAARSPSVTGTATRATKATALAKPSAATNITRSVPAATAVHGAGNLARQAVTHPPPPAIGRSAVTAVAGKAKGLIGRATQFATKVHR